MPYKTNTLTAKLPNSWVALKVILTLEENGGWKRSQRELAKQVGATYRRVLDVVSILEELGVLEKGKRIRDNAPCEINLSVKWKENGNG